MSKRQTAVDLLPAWTKHVAADLGGRDPLGLSRVSQMIADWLMPGIVTQTNRARYYAIYCWILWHVQENEDNATETEFAEAFQRREIAIAVATLLQDENANGSPVGVRAVSTRLDQAREQGKLDTSFRVLPSNRLGGYGQYYGGCMYLLGLTHRPEGSFDQVTPAGADLARSVHANLAQTPYIARRQFALQSVSLDILEQSSARLSIDAITHKFAYDERRRLIDLFFEFDRDAPGFRQNSLAHILHLIGLYETHGIPVMERSLEKQLLYAPAYYEVLVADDGRTTRAACPDILRVCRAYWRQFCLHQYLTQAAEWLLVAVLQTIEESTKGRTLDEITHELVCEDFRQFLRDAIGSQADTPHALMIKIAENLYPYEHPLSEASLIHWEADSRPRLAAWSAAWSCLLFAVLYSKWRHETGDHAYVDVMAHAGNELTAATIFGLLDTWHNTTMTWEIAVRSLVQDIVINQHDRVMYSKGRLESCWLHPDEDRFVQDQDYGPYLRPPRHRQAINILVDLGLVQKLEDEQLVLTAAGHAVCNRLIGGGK